MKINPSILTYNCYFFLKHVESIIKNIDEGCVISLDFGYPEEHKIYTNTTIYDRLYIIERCWIKTKRQIKEDSDNNKVIKNFTEVQQSSILGATESIVNILKDKNKSNNVKFFEIKMIISVFNK